MYNKQFKYRKDSFPLILNKYYLVEMYYRNYYRKKMVDALVNTGFHIDIAGEWWESYDKINSPNVIWNKAVRFDKSYELIAGYRAMADSSPFLRVEYMTGYMQELLIILQL